MRPNKSKSYRNKFNIEWCEMEDFKKWLRPVDDDENSGWCCLCEKSFDIRGMGKAAVTIHGSGLKHKRLFAIKFSKSNPSILGFLNRVPSLNSTSPSAHENVNKNMANEEREREVLVVLMLKFLQ